MKIHIENHINRNITTTITTINSITIKFPQTYLLKLLINNKDKDAFIFLFEFLIEMISIYYKKFCIFIIFFVINYFIQKRIKQK